MARSIEKEPTPELEQNEPVRALIIDKNNILDIIKNGHPYIKTGLSWGRRFGMIEWLRGFVSPIKRPANKKSKHVLCMGKEGYQPLHPSKDFLFMGHDLLKPETVEFWSIGIDTVEQIKEETGRTVKFDGKIWKEYRNKNIVTAIFIIEAFTLTDQDGRNFNSDGNYWVIFDHTTKNWFPCDPEKFKYTRTDK